MKLREIDKDCSVFYLDYDIIYNNDDKDCCLLNGGALRSQVCHYDKIESKQRFSQIKMI